MKCKLQFGLAAGLVSAACLVYVFVLIDQQQPTRAEADAVFAGSVSVFAPDLGIEAPEPAATDSLQRAIDRPRRVLLMPSVKPHLLDAPGPGYQKQLHCIGTGGDAQRDGAAQHYELSPKVGIWE